MTLQGELQYNNNNYSYWDPTPVLLKKDKKMNNPAPVSVPAQSVTKSVSPKKAVPQTVPVAQTKQSIAPQYNYTSWTGSALSSSVPSKQAPIKPKSSMKSTTFQPTSKQSIAPSQKLNLWVGNALSQNSHQSKNNSSQVPPVNISPTISAWKPVPDKFKLNLISQGYYGLHHMEKNALRKEQTASYGTGPLSFLNSLKYEGEAALLGAGAGVLSTAGGVASFIVGGANLITHPTKIPKAVASAPKKIQNSMIDTAKQVRTGNTFGYELIGNIGAGYGLGKVGEFFSPFVSKVGLKVYSKFSKLSKKYQPTNEVLVPDTNKPVTVFNDMSAKSNRVIREPANNPFNPSNLPKARQPFKKLIIGGQDLNLQIKQGAEAMSEKITPFRLIKRVANKDVWTVHVSESPKMSKPLGKGKNVILEGVPDYAKRFRKSNDLLHFYRSVPDKTGNPQVYTGYLSLTDAGSESVQKVQYTLFKPKAYAYLEKVHVNYATPLKNENVLSYTERVMGKPTASGKTFLGGENVLGQSNEAQVVTTAKFTGVKGVEYSGSVIAKSKDLGFTWFDYDEGVPGLISKSKTLTNIYKKLGLNKRPVKLHLMEIKTQPIEDAVKNIGTVGSKGAQSVNSLPTVISNKKVFASFNPSSEYGVKYVSASDMLSNSKTITATSLTSSVLSKGKKPSVPKSISSLSKPQIKATPLTQLSSTTGSVKMSFSEPVIKSPVKSFRPLSTKKLSISSKTKSVKSTPSQSTPISYSSFDSSSSSIVPSPKRSFKSSSKPSQKPSFKPSYKPSFKSSFKPSFKPSIKPISENLLSSHQSFKPSYKPSYHSYGKGSQIRLSVQSRSHSSKPKRSVPHKLPKQKPVFSFRRKTFVKTFLSDPMSVLKAEISGIKFSNKPKPTPTNWKKASKYAFNFVPIVKKKSKKKVKKNVFGF